ARERADHPGTRSVGAHTHPLNAGQVVPLTVVPLDFRTRKLHTPAPLVGRKLIPMVAGAYRRDTAWAVAHHRFLVVATIHCYGTGLRQYLSPFCWVVGCPCFTGEDLQAPH